MQDGLKQFIPVGVEPVSITVVGLSSLGVFGNHNFTSTAFPAANRALFYPFRTGVPRNVQKLYVLNGGVLSGNLDLGIYNADGVRLISTGSTVQAGVSLLQAISAPILLAPGRYYLALACDNNTATFIGSQFLDSKELRAYGCLTQNVFPLPAVATFASFADQHVFYAGVGENTII